MYTFISSLLGSDQSDQLRAPIIIIYIWCRQSMGQKSDVIVLFGATKLSFWIRYSGRALVFVINKWGEGNCCGATSHNTSVHKWSETQISVREKNKWIIILLLMWLAANIVCVRMHHALESISDGLSMRNAINLLAKRNQNRFAILNYPFQWNFSTNKIEPMIHTMAILHRHNFYIFHNLNTLTANESLTYSRQI